MSSVCPCETGEDKRLMIPTLIERGGAERSMSLKCFLFRCCFGLKQAPRPTLMGTFSSHLD